MEARQSNLAPRIIEPRVWIVASVRHSFHGRRWPVVIHVIRIPLERGWRRRELRSGIESRGAECKEFAHEGGNDARWNLITNLRRLELDGFGGFGRESSQSGGK